MPDNRQNQDNAASDHTVEEDIMRKLKIDKNDTQNDNDKDNEEEKAVTDQTAAEEDKEGVTVEVESNQYPNRPNEPDCIYFLRTGSCGYGDACKFNHPPHATAPPPPATATAKFVHKYINIWTFNQDKGELPQRDGQPDCGYFLKTGTCKYGSTCKYHHPKDRHGAEPTPLNILGLPIREGEKSCPYYLRTSTCKFGAACKFHHPQPAPVDTTSMVSSNFVPDVSGAMGSAGLTSNVWPYVNGLPTWPLPMSPYMAGQRDYGPHAYMPFVFPPQGVIPPARGLGTYMNQGELNINGQHDLATAGFCNLPERPDQPECRYFISNGSCKYGSGCKFHHPKERIAQVAMNGLGPHGLPLRPGRPMCSHFSAYGACKYGSNCKFDHPISAYVPGYDLGVQSIPMLDQSVHPYRRNSLSTSPPKSVKITEWIKKPESFEVDGNSDADCMGDQHGRTQLDSSG